MNSLRVLGPCGANCCDEVQPPSEPAASCPWDVLTVRHDDNAFFLARCCPVTTPLLSPVGGYDTGETVPYYQPDGVGPPLGASGAYQIRAERRQIIFGDGISLFNNRDCVITDPSDSTQAGAFGQDYEGTCFTSATYDPAGAQFTWALFKEAFPAFLRTTAPDDNGDTWAVYGMISQANEEPQTAPLTKYATFNLDAGVGYGFVHTDDLDATAPINTLGTSRAFHPQSGNGLAIASDRIVMRMTVSRVTSTIRHLRTNLVPTNPDGAWLEPGALEILETSWASGARARVAYRLDDARYSLEIEQGGGGTRVWAVDHKGRAKLLTTRAPAEGFPFCYTRRGTRHVFLWDARTTAVAGDAGAPLGTHLFDIDECEISTCNPSGEGRNLDDEGFTSAVYATTTARGELAFISGGRVVVGDWSLAVSSVNNNAWLSQGSYNGWIHVRNARITDLPFDLGEPSFYAPYSDVSASTETYDVSRTFSIHPEGPSHGVTAARQFTASSEYLYDPPRQGTDGTELVQFVGELWNGVYDNNEARSLKRPGEGWTASSGAGSELPFYSFGYGVGAAPMPAHYGPGATAAY